MDAPAAGQRPPFLLLTLGLLAAVALRLPQLVGGGVLLDGDEAIVGLMAEHLRTGRDVPVFFWGQGYGLATFEAAAGAIAFALLGASATSLKIAMLALWACGWVFYALAIRRLLPVRSAIVGALLLATCPAWGTWSTLARGGYVTMFVASGLWLLLFARLPAQPARAPLRLALLGVVAALVYLAQPIGCVALAPLLALIVWRGRLRAALLLAVPAAATWAAVWFAGGGGEGYWAPLLLREVDLVGALARLPQRAFTFFTGAYYYLSAVAVGVLTQAAALAWCLLLALALALAGRDALRRREPLAVACGLGIALVLAFTLVVDAQTFAFRYLLPVAALLVVALACALAPLRARWPLALAGLVIALGAVALLESGAARLGDLEQRRNARRSLTTLVNGLRRDGIEHVYCLDAMLQWNLMFESNERVLARWRHPNDRRPEYPRAVDRALFAGRKVAIVGAEHDLRALLAELAARGGPQPKLVASGGTLARLESPGPGFPMATLLEGLGFALNRS